MLAGEEWTGRRERALGIALLLALLLCLLAALIGRRLPETLAPEAPDELFSAGRALRLLESVARAPHPVGSSEHECVREFLVQQLGGLGRVEEQRGTVRSIPVTNLLVRIPGCASTGTVLCLAHYDSMPSGPGAGDDGVGVVAWLESLRALRARGWQPANDVLLLLSDGEELVLLGAQLFAARHPRAGEVKTVVNLEAIGNGGPALLFQLGPENGARVRAFEECVAAPTGTSLGDGLFRRMPNDTDLTVFLLQGITGFNLALTSGSNAYHAPHDTPGNLDPRSLQHMGECAMALVERLGELDLATLSGAEVTFFDLLGRRLVLYPRAWDVLFMILSFGLTFHSWRCSRLGARELWDTLRRHALGCLGLAVALTGAWWLLDRLFALVTPDPSWTPGNTTSGALLCAGLVLTISGLAVLRSDRPVETIDRRVLAARTAWSSGALLGLLWLPGGAFVFHVPSVLSALGGSALRARRARLLGQLLHLVCFGAALFLCLPILHLLLQLTQCLPVLAVFLCGALLASAVDLFAPSMRSIARAGRHAGSALLVLGLGALCVSVFVARVLAWRQGALWP